MRASAVLAAMLVTFWSSGFVGATLATDHASFVTALAWRTLVSALLLGAAALVRGQRITRGEVLRQVQLGLLVQVVYLGGVFAATEAGVPAGTNALIAAMQPLLVAALAGRFTGRSATRRQVAGLVVATAGVGLVVAGDLGGSAPTVAFALPVLAVLGLAGGTVLSARWQGSTSLLVALAVQSAVAALVFGTAGAVSGRFVPPATGGFWLSIGWLVGLSTVGGYGTYLLVVRRHGPTYASTLLYLTPPATALWAWLLFGQTPGALALPGVLVCVTGVGLFLRRSRRAPSRPAGQPDGTDAHDIRAGSTSDWAA